MCTKGWNQNIFTPRWHRVVRRRALRHTVIASKGTRKELDYAFNPSTLVVFAAAIPDTNTSEHFICSHYGLKGMPPTLQQSFQLKRHSNVTYTLTELSAPSDTQLVGVKINAPWRTPVGTLCLHPNVIYSSELSAQITLKWLG